MQRFTDELEWILPRSAGDEAVVNVAGGVADLQPIALGAAVSFFLVLLSGALWIVGVAATNEPEGTATAHVSVMAVDR